MTRFLFISILPLLIVSGAGASELTGTISTDPEMLNADSTSPRPASPQAMPQTEADARDAGKPLSGGPGIILPAQKIDLSGENRHEKTPKDARTEKIKVLGARFYPSGTLLRASDKRIYLTAGEQKKPVINLRELAKYQGQAIYDVDDEQLSQYQTRGYLDGELIRERGTVKIYVVRHSAKRHILNLEELRARYFGLEIQNISREEMMMY